MINNYKIFPFKLFTKSQSSKKKYYRK